MPHPPDETARAQRDSILDPYRAKIQALVERYPTLSAVRICEEIRRGSDGYPGSVITVRRYVREIRPARGRVYQEVVYEPGQAMQVDWGHCGKVTVDGTSRKVSVFVAVLCYSRMSYIEFTLSQRKAEFYRAIVHALEFFQGSPRRIIFDNLKAAVVNGSGRNACLHPEFLALCGHFCLEPIACARRDPESKDYASSCTSSVRSRAFPPYRRVSVSLSPWCLIGRCSPTGSYKHVLVTVNVRFQKPTLAPSSHSLHVDVQFRGDFFLGQHAPFAKPVVAALQSVFPPKAANNEPGEMAAGAGT